MINFTVGPVQSSEAVCNVGAEQVPYFRTEEFSKIMFENDALIRKFARAPQHYKTAFLTASGTAAMEASVANLLTSEDKAIVINGGSFGERFVQLCEIYNVPHDVIKLKYGKQLTEEMLNEFDGKGYTALLVNLHETSTGVYYDISLISEFCKKNQLLLIVDSISSFLADEFNMESLGVDVMITSSQKALACPPGVSILILSLNAIDRINKNSPKCMYLNLKDALKNAERGQTPFTPAVGILRQINVRLKEIDKNGGVESENKRIANLAEDFRNKIKTLPFEIVSESLSNAVTPLHPISASAYDIFLKLKDEYGIWVCPNGGDLKNEIFRVGHIGNLTIKDNDILIAALKDLKKKQFI